MGSALSAISAEGREIQPSWQTTDGHLAVFGRAVKSWSYTEGLI